MNEHLLKKNLERFRKLNIDKWQDKVTGQGIKIGIIGFSAGAHHNGAWLVQQIAPGSQIIEYNVMDRDSYRYSWEEAFQKMLDDDIDIVCCSLRKRTWNDNLEALSKQLYEDGVVMIDSADNNGGKIDAWPAMSQYWFVVGSYNERTNKNYSWSRYGPQLTFLMYTDFACDNGKGRYIPISHTSGSTQVPAGMVALLKEYFEKKNFGPKEFEKFLEKYCIDLDIEGKDLDTGWGLFVLPEELPKKEVKEVSRFKKYTPEKALEILENMNIIRTINEIHFHHTFKPNHEDYKTAEDKESLIWSMYRYHTQEKGWNDIGQNFTIDPDGFVWFCRDINIAPASISGRNTYALAIENIGNFDIGYDKLEKDQLQANVAFLRGLFNLLPGVKLIFHREYSNKTCPGTSINKEELLKMIDKSGNVNLTDVSDWAKDSWIKAVKKGVNDGEGPQNPVTEEQLMVFLDRLGLLD